MAKVTSIDFMTKNILWKLLLTLISLTIMGQYHYPGGAHAEERNENGLQIIMCFTNSIVLRTHQTTTELFIVEFLAHSEKLEGVITEACNFYLFVTSFIYYPEHTRFKRACRSRWRKFTQRRVMDRKLEEAIFLNAGDDIQAMIDAHPPGTMFYLEAGVYRLQNLTPKDNQMFLGEDGAVLNGAVVLEGWAHEGGLWVMDGLPDPLDLGPFGSEWGSDLAKAREDMFIDGVLYQRVGSLNELGQGKWYYENNKAYIVDDPSNKLTELGVTPQAFGGSAVGVVIENLTVEKYATMVHRGAIHGREGTAWEIDDVVAQWNHSVGLTAGDDFRVNGGSFSNNGQLGIFVVRGDDVIIDGVTVAYNNYAGFNQSWEAGGIKFAWAENITIINSQIHNNFGNGLWGDIDSDNARIEGNHVFENQRQGIEFEISTGAVITENWVAYNGWGGYTWLYGSGILIHNASNVDVSVALPVNCQLWSLVMMSVAVA